MLLVKVQLMTINFIMSITTYIMLLTYITMSIYAKILTKTNK